jgi:quinoprotein glucose dehydrogenase
MLYFSANDVIALDAETGKQVWRFNARNARGRGVAYYRSPGASGNCAERIITNTTDARLIAVDAHNGKPCSGFGTNGEVSLLTGMGEVIPGYYSVTSTPTIVQDKIVVGGSVLDFQYWGEPSGVTRAFDAVTGKLTWAWDVGHPDRTGESPPGESYTRSTPNSWAPMSVDETLGLVYLATGDTNGTAFFGGYRRPFDEQYSNAIVVLDATTGRPRWSFQTVHHDLWDYDVASQPTLVDLSIANSVIHGLIQPTKRGELFILDRATGTPIYPIEERPAPQTGVVPEDHVSLTQPYSTGLPSFRGADLVEGDMWGITPLDQLWCRIKFREMRYEGTLTPPGLSPAIEMPGPWGGVNWGGVAVDVDRGIVIVNSTNVAYYTRFLPRVEADKLGKRYSPTNKIARINMAPQEGTPYGVLKGGFFSPLQVPCNRPPFGRLSAVDLRTGKLIWSQVFGTARDIGPLGIPSLLPLPIGTSQQRRSGRHSEWPTLYQRRPGPVSALL